MRGFLFLLCLVFYNASLVLSHSPVPGKLISNNNSPPPVFAAFGLPDDIPPPVRADPVAPAVSCDAKEGTMNTYCNHPSTGTICDATGINFCKGTTKDDAKFIACGGSQKYCVQLTDTEAECSSTPAQGCDAKNNGGSFQCTQEGILPDISDCRRYFYCEKDSSTKKFKAAEEYLCPEFYAYDPSLPDESPCRYTNNDIRHCITAECKAEDRGLKILKYPNLKAEIGVIGVKCFDKDISAPIVTRCGANSILKDSGVIPRCVINCRREGQKAPHKETTKYYQCFRSSGGLLPVEWKCLGDQKFDKIKLTCVK